MKNKKRVFTAEQKVRILREHLDNQVPVSELCERYGIQPNSFYTRKKKLFEGALQTFATQPNHKKHPQFLTDHHISDFLTYLAVKGNVAASTQNQAMSALVFLYREVLNVDVLHFQSMVTAKKPTKLPTVFDKNEVKRIFLFLDGTPFIMAALLYGSGLRLMECIRLRVKDVRTTMIYTHVLNRGGFAVNSPFDTIFHNG